MRKVFANALIELAENNPKICFITPDMGYSIIDDFQIKFPDRYFNLGISEQNVIAVAAGMALSGYKPYVYSVIPFIVHRCLEQIRVNISYTNLDVKVIGIGAGFEYGIAGATHQGTEDITIMRSLPNFEVYSPGSFYEMEAITKLTAQNNHPTYIRIGRMKNSEVHSRDKIEPGKAAIVEEGKDVAFVATGSMLPVAYEVAQEFKKDGINPMVISMHAIKPIDKECILNLINGGYKIYTFEEHTILGGLGSAIAEIIAESGKAVQFKRIGINDEFSHIVGNSQYIREQFKLDKEGILKQLITK